MFTGFSENFSCFPRKLFEAGFYSRHLRCIEVNNYLKRKKGRILLQASTEGVYYYHTIMLYKKLKCQRFILGSSAALTEIVQMLDDTKFIMTIDWPTFCEAEALQ